MSAENTHLPSIELAFAKVLHWLSPEEPPVLFAQQVQTYAQLRGELGNDAICESLQVDRNELVAINKNVSDVDRRLKAGAGEDDRNLQISQLRLLSWFETIGQRHPGDNLKIDLDEIVSEDMGRRRVRAIELVCRCLVGERHADQQHLVAHLKSLVGDKAVDKWLRSADRDDVLSGTAFSELASIFVNKKEFEHYEHLYEETPFLSLLREKRKTIQSFLEDIRRIRNTLAHNKQISPVQLALLDLYYDELMSPVEQSHAAGDTCVDPAQFLEVSQADLADYFANLHDDLMSVKDDIGELRAEMSKGFAEVSADTAQIRETTHGINRRLAWTLGGVAVAVVIATYGAYLTWGTGEQVAQIDQTTKQIDRKTSALEDTTKRITARTLSIDASTKELTETGKRIEATTDEIAATSKRIEESTQEMAATGNRIESTTDEIADTSKRVEKTTNEIAATSKQIESTTDEIADTSKRVEKTTNEIAATSKHIESTTDEIADTGRRVEKNTAEIRDSVKIVAETNERVVTSLEAIRDGFASLTKLGGIIPEPDSPQEVYHNARVYEQKGDYGNARKSYVQYFAFDLELVDPHLRFQSFLKLQEGRAGARETYHELKARSKSLVTEYAAILLQEPNGRVKRLMSFVNDHPEFAPAFYELSREFSEARLGQQAADDKAQELKYLESFLKLHEQGRFVRYLLDKEVADEQLAEARERLEALRVVSRDALKNPVTLTALRSNSGWLVNVGIVGQVKEILYKREGETDFVSTGFMNLKNTETGFAMPRTQVELGAKTPAMNIHVKYIDTRDRTHGPFTVRFDPNVERFRTAKQILDITTNSWVLLRDYDGKTLLYFSHLMTQRYALAEIRYGLDVEKPGKLYKFPPADPDNPYSIGDQLPFMEVPGTTKYVTVQLKYTDGSLSKIHKFAR